MNKNHKPQLDPVPYLISEVATMLNVSLDHVYDLVDEGQLRAVDVAGKGATRKVFRIPVEAYREFVTRRSTMNPPAVQTPAPNRANPAKQ